MLGRSEAQPQFLFFQMPKPGFEGEQMHARIWDFHWNSVASGYPEGYWCDVCQRTIFPKNERHAAHGA